MFAVKQWHKASSAAEASRLLLEHPGCRLISGGTDVLIRLREGDDAYADLVDIHNLAELRPIVARPDGTLRVGAGATFTEIMESPLVKERIPALAEAAASVAGPQIRNVGTIGGNLCNGAVSADTCAPVLALNGRLRILGPQGERETPARGFHTGPGRVALNPGEVLLGVDFRPEDWKGRGSRYFKYAMRGAMDIATIGCAASVRLEDGVIADLRLTYAVAGPIPLRCPKAEAAAVGKSGRAALEAVSAAVENDVNPRSSWRAGREFRLHVIRVLAERVLGDAMQRAGGVI